MTAHQHLHALDTERSLRGVRLSYALRDWVALGVERNRVTSLCIQRCTRREACAGCTDGGGSSGSWFARKMPRIGPCAS